MAWALQSHKETIYSQRLVTQTMAISFQSALGLREHAFTIRAERAAVLSSNLANVDTPNYKARDIDFHAELNKRMTDASTFKAKSTHAAHLSLGSEPGMSDRLYRTPGQPSIDGNSVEEHVEHAEFMKNSLEFQVAFTLLNSSFKGLTKALRGE